MGNLSDHNYLTEFYTQQNTFWNIGNMDPYKALSFDHLHANHLGLFKDHLWGTMKKLVQAEGRTAVGQVDDQLV